MEPIQCPLHCTDNGKFSLWRVSPGAQSGGGERVGEQSRKKKKKFAQGAQSSNPFIQPCQNLKAYFCSPFFFPFLFLLSCINLPGFSQIFEVNGEF